MSSAPPQLTLDDLRFLLLGAQDLFVLVDGLLKLGHLLLQFDATQPGELAKLHCENALCLALGKAELLHEIVPGVGAVLAGADDGDDLIQHVQGFQQAFDDMRPVFGLLEKELGAPRDDLAPVRQEELDAVLEVQQPRHDGLTTRNRHQRHHVHREARPQLRALVQVVQHYIGVGVALEFDHDPHPLAVALVAQVGDALNLVLLGQRRDLHEQRGLRDLVGKFGDDDRGAVAVQRLNDCPGLHDH